MTSPRRYTPEDASAITGLKPEKLTGFWRTAVTMYPVAADSIYLDDTTASPERSEPDYSLQEVLFLLACLGVPVNIARSHPVTLEGIIQLLGWPVSQSGTLTAALGRDGSWSRPRVGAAPTMSMSLRRWRPDSLAVPRRTADGMHWPLREHDGFVLLPRTAKDFPDVEPLPEQLTPVPPPRTTAPARTPALQAGTPQVPPATRDKSGAQLAERAARGAHATPARQGGRGPGRPPKARAVAAPERAPAGYLTADEIKAATGWTDAQFGQAAARAATRDFIPRAAEDDQTTAPHYWATLITGYRRAVEAYRRP